MKRVFRSAWSPGISMVLTIWLTLGCLPGNGFAQASASPPAGGEYHQFADKTGRKMEAKVVSVSADRKTMKIQLKDGKEANLEIVLLSLDDQQFLKGWLATQSAVASAPQSYRLDVAIEKFAALPSDRRRSGDYRLTTEHVGYRIKVKNLARDTMPGPTVESFVIKKEGMMIYRDPTSGGWTFSSSSDGSDERIHETKNLENLEYNREQVVTTKTADLDEVLGDGNYLYGKDDLVGLIVQIRDQNGQVVGVWRSSDSGIAKVEWESLAGQSTVSDNSRPGFGPGGGFMSRRPIELAQGESFDGAELDVADRPFNVQAVIAPDAVSPDGIIASHGGVMSGWSLMVRGRELVFAVRISQSVVNEVVSPVPSGSGEFKVSAHLTSETQSLDVEGQVPVEKPSLGLLPDNPKQPLSVGYEEGNSVTPDYEAPFRFKGTIKEFTLRFDRGRPRGPGFQ